MKVREAALGRVLRFSRSRVVKPLDEARIGDGSAGALSGRGIASPVDLGTAARDDDDDGEDEFDVLTLLFQFSVQRNSSQMLVVLLQLKTFGCIATTLFHTYII